MKQIVFSLHAKQQMVERGASQEEVTRAIREGKAEPVRDERLMYRLNIEYDAKWRGKHYAIKQVAPVVAAEEAEKIVVVTVYTFFF